MPFRRYYFGQLISGCGSWAETVAEGWLAYAITGSPLLVGLLAAARSLPILLLSVPAGLLIDRRSHQAVLLYANALGSVVAGLLAGLTLAGTIDFRLLMVGVCALGTLSAFEQPARQVYLVELAAPGRLGMAVSLGALSHNLARVVGPVIGGVAIASVGPYLAFAINAVAFLAVVVALKRNGPGLNSRPVPKGAFLHSLGRLADNRERRKLLFLLALNTVFAAPYVYLGPSLVDGLGGGAEALGWMWSAIGIGAIGATVRLARRPTSQHGFEDLASASTLLGMGLLGVYASSSLGITLGLFVLVGWSMATYLSVSNIVLLSSTAADLRGTASAAYVLVVTGFIPLGSVLLGTVAQVSSTRLAFGVGAIAWLSLFAFVSLRRPRPGIEPNADLEGGRVS